MSEIFYIVKKLNIVDSRCHTHPTPTQNTCKGFLSLYMVSQFGSVGSTIMGKTADPTVVQKSLHPSPGGWRSSLKKLAVGEAVSNHIHRKLSGRGKLGKKRCTSNRDNRSHERQSSKGLLTIWRSFTKSRLRQESRAAWTDPGHGLQLSHSSCHATPEPETTSDASYLGWENNNWSVFSDENFEFNLELKVP